MTTLSSRDQLPPGLIVDHGIAEAASLAEIAPLRSGRTLHPFPPRRKPQLTKASDYRESGINWPVARTKEQP